MENILYKNIEKNIENLKPNSIVFFAYDLENDENLWEKIFLEKIKNLNSNLDNIFSLNNEIKQENWRIILTWINDIKINFSRKKSDKFDWKFFITEIILENLNVDINKEEKHFLQTFYYILKDLEWLNINYIDDSFTDVLDEHITWNKECSVWEICSFIQTFKEKFLEEDNETPKYLELIKFLSKKNFEKKDLENIEKLLEDEFFIKQKDEILELIEDLDIKKILEKINKWEEISEKEKKIIQENNLKIRNKKYMSKTISGEIPKEIEDLKKDLFKKFKEKIIAKEFQNLLNFYLEMRRIIFTRAELFQNDLEKNIFSNNNQDLLLEYFLEKKSENTNVLEVKKTSEEILDNANKRQEEEMELYDETSKKMILESVMVLQNLEFKLLNFYEKLENIFHKLESWEEIFLEEELNLSEKIILETEKQIKKIPDLFQKVSFIISKIPNILWNKKEKKETNNEKEKREIAEFYNITLKILAEKNFLEQKNDENLEKKLNTKIEFLKEKYKNNEIIQSIKYFPLEKIRTKIFSYEYARNANVNYHINYHKKNKNSSFVFQFWNEKLNNELWKLSKEKPEVNKYLIQSKDFPWHNDWINNVDYKNFLEFWNYNDVREFFDNYEHFKKLAFFKKYNFLYNENEEKYYKLIYLKESFICEKTEECVEYWIEKDFNIEMRIKKFFENLKQDWKIKNISCAKSKILFEIELNNWEKIELKIINNNIVVLWLDSKKSLDLDELEKLFLDWEKESIKNYQYFVKNSVNYILEKNKNILDLDYIIPNFSKNFSTINTQLKAYKNIENQKYKIFKQHDKNFFDVSETKTEELGFNSYSWIFYLLKNNSDLINFQITWDKEKLYKDFQKPIFEKAYVKIKDNNYVKLQISNSYEIVKFLLDIDYERLKDDEEILYKEFYDLEKVYFLQNVNVDETEKRKEFLEGFFLDFKNLLTNEIEEKNFNDKLWSLDNFLKTQFKEISVKYNFKVNSSDTFEKIDAKILCTINLFDQFYINLLYNNLYEIFRITLIEKEKYVDLDKFNEFFLENLNSVLEPVSTKYQYIDNYFWKIG